MPPARPLRAILRHLSPAGPTPRAAPAAAAEAAQLDASGAGDEAARAVAHRLTATQVGPQSRPSSAMLATPCD
jgi:hypothetical protein